MEKKNLNFKPVSTPGFMETDVKRDNTPNAITVGYDEYNPFASEKPKREVDDETKKVIKSKTMLTFFKYDQGKFSINREELFVLPSARKIITSDRGGMIKGDSDGRKKLWSEKQFALAWWCININSPSIQAGLEGDELIEDARRTLEIPKDWDHTKDETFMAFYYDYEEMYEKASYARLLKQMLMSFNDTASIVKMIRDHSTKLLRANRDLDAADIAALMSSQKELIALSGDIPKQIDKLKNLQAMVRKEEKEIETARGGITITASMDPDNN